MIDDDLLSRPDAVGAALWTGTTWSPEYGAVLDAAVHAAVAPATANRAGVLDTLRNAAVAWKVQTELAHPYDDAWAAYELAPGVRVADVRRPLVEQLPKLLERFADTSPDVRREVARLAGVLPERRDVTVPALESAVADETDVLARLAMLFALARLGAPRRPTGAVPSNPVHAVATRLVDMVAGGPLDDALLVVDAARKLGGLGNLVRGFPGGDNTVLTSAAAIVAEIMRRDDRATMERFGDAGQLAECVALALWPFASPPPEPRTTVSTHERAWLEPITKKNWAGAVTPTLVPSTLVRCGFAPGFHAAKLVGMAECGAADTILSGESPAWLVARRVCDGRLPVDVWSDAMRAQPADAILAIVADLRSYAIDKPWPTTMTPSVRVPDLDASDRFYALARAAYAHVPVARLEAFIGGARDPLHATALASMVDRGVALAPSHDARLGDLLTPYSLAFAESEWDVQGLRTAFAALPTARRAAAIAHAAPGVVLDSHHDAARLTGAWRFVDMASPELFPKLVAHLIEVSGFPEQSKPKTEKHHAMNRAFLAEIERATRAAGPAFIDALRAAMSAKPKKAAKAVLERALAAAGATAADVPKAKPPKRSASRKP